MLYDSIKKYKNIEDFIDREDFIKIYLGENYPRWNGFPFEDNRSEHSSRLIFIAIIYSKINNLSDTEILALFGEILNNFFIKTDLGDIKNSMRKNNYLKKLLNNGGEFLADIKDIDKNLFIKYNKGIEGKSNIKIDLLSYDEDLYSEYYYIYQLFVSLRDEKRFNNSFMLRKDNVLNHSFRSFYILYDFLEETDYEDSLKVEILIKMILHDMEESIAGDVVAPVKYKNKRINREIDQETSKVIFNFKDILIKKYSQDEEMVNYIFDLAINCKSVSIDDVNIVDFFDKLDVIFFLKFRLKELELNEERMEAIIKKQLKNSFPE